MPAADPYHGLDATARARLASLGEALIPRDATMPSVTDLGFVEFVARQWQELSERERSLLAQGLEGRASPIGEAELVALSLRDPAFVELAGSLAAQAYYTHPSTFASVGFDPAPKLPYSPVVPAIRTIARAAIRKRYDAIVIGAGAGGATVACTLAEAGMSVLVIERGDWLRYEQVGRDHLRNHRFPRFGHNTGPDAEGHPRVLATDAGERTRRPHEAGWHNNAMTVGGGTRVYGAQAWRFAPDDFRMATRYGVPAGSSLADWPFGYETLAPWYDRVEHELGVCGETGHSHQGARATRFPMPPLPDNESARVLRAAAVQLGWTARAVPLAINSQPRDGRPACVRCGTCVGFACPSESKNGAHNTFLPRALATSHCDLLTHAQVARVLTDRHGRAAGVECFHDDESGVARLAIEADRIVVAAGAIETARLMLLSGLGNAHDQVGRHLQGHTYSGAVGLAATDVQDSRGPGASVAVCNFAHGNDGVIGGGMLANEFVPLPVHFWHAFLPALPRYGAAGKQAMSVAYRRTIAVMGPIQEVPKAGARVTLHPTVRDRFGLPVARLAGHAHEETLRTAAMLRTRADAWLDAAGTTHRRSFGGGARGHLSAGQHQAGTCRVGDDPRTSVTDRDGRVHGHANVHVADASLHVTNGSVNPVLTVFANALRIANGIVSD